jgi:hypothetical protein
VGFSSSRPLGAGLALLLLAGRVAVSERTRSEVCGLRIARRVSCRDSWSADIVDTVCEVDVCKMELSTMVVENHHHLSLGKNFPLRCGQTSVSSERRRHHALCIMLLIRPLDFSACLRVITWLTLLFNTALRKAFILFCLYHFYIHRPEQLF